MTQCAVEERLNLRLAIQGLVTYAETLSVYGTEAVFVDGDDTPWSKALLASAYASRGVKVRFTSGGGSEALMGESEGKSMLYLEARCLSVVRAAGSQGVQNGSISCVALALAVPGGTREVLAENVLAAWLDLEVASGNDAIASHSEIRKTAKLMGQFLPGTDFVTSGYSSMPRYDNMFGGGNYDSHDYDEWLTIQRDWQVDAGIEPLVRGRRRRGARASRAGGAGGVRRARLPGGLGRGGAARSDVPRLARPARPRPRGRRGSRRPRAGRGDLGLDVARALARRGFARRRRGGLRHAAAARRGRLPADGGGDRRRRHRRVGGERAERLPRPRHRLPPRGRALGAAAAAAARDRRTAPRCRRGGRAAAACRCGDASPSDAADDVVIAVGPAFGGALAETINGLAHADVLARSSTACARAGRRRGSCACAARPTSRSSATTARCSSGSGVAVGLQSKGTALIHRADLEPLDNLELFGMAPALTLASYRQIGANAAGYALGRAVVAGADDARQLRAGEADRAHDAAARARGGRGRARRAARRRSSSRRAGACMSKAPTEPYPPDPDEDAEPPTALGDLMDAVVADADWSNERGRGVAWKRVELRRCRLTGVELAEAVLTDVTFAECRLDLPGCG